MPVLTTQSERSGDHDGSRVVVGYRRCELQGSDCVCIGRELGSQQWSVSNGTYRVEGTTLETASGVVFDYCRKGDRVTLVRLWTPIDGHDGAAVRTRIELTVLGDPALAPPTE